MKGFIDTLNKIKEKSSILKLDLFSDENIKLYDEPYKNLSLKHTPVEYFYTQDTSITLLKGGNFDEKLKEINDVLKNIKNNLWNYRKELSSQMNFKKRFEEIINKKNILNIKQKYNIKFPDTVYLYTTKNNVNIFGSLEYKYMNYIINKKIKNINDNVFLCFNMTADEFDFYKNNIIYCTFGAINKLNIGKDMILGCIYAPHVEKMMSFYILLINCFSDIHIEYSIWSSSSQNFVYFVLKNKHKNVKMPDITNNYDYNIKIENVENYSNIINSLLKFEQKIFKYILYDIKICNQLYLLKYNDYKLYLSLSNKIYEKITNI
jgi:hypothetical protein